MLRKTIDLIVVLSIGSLLLFSIWLAFEIQAAKPLPKGQVLFEVKRGMGARAIASNLKEEGLIKRTGPFLIALTLFYSPKNLKAGEYVFHSPLSLKTIFLTLLEGKVHLRTLTVPEGLTIMETARHIRSGFDGILEEEFLDASFTVDLISDIDEEAEDLEGYIFPETYHFPKGTPAGDIMSSMVSHFKAVFNDDWRKRSSELGMSIREVVILASLIEKETALDEEKALVSAVFHNRLRHRMKLDCDPTIIYAFKKEGGFQGRLRTRDLKFDSPYNTYLYPGLPPGPICNPGRESLLAALYPADVDHLYFVSRNDGSHEFNRTYSQHLAAVRKYQKN